MSYAVYHVEKGAVSPGGIGKHIDREPGAEHTYQHADPERIHLNEHITVTPIVINPFILPSPTELKRVTMPK